MWEGHDRERACLVEVEGLTRYGKVLGRHQSAAGYEGDLKKYNSAVLAHGTMFRFSENMIADGTMERTLRDWFDGDSS